MNKLINALNNRMLIAIVVGLFVWSFVRRVVGR